MLNRKIEHAKFPTRGKLLDFFIKILEIEHNTEADKKRYQRFITEENIGPEEYKEMLNKKINEIVERLICDETQKHLTVLRVHKILDYYLKFIQKIEVYPYQASCINHLLIKYFYLPALMTFFQKETSTEKKPINIEVFNNSRKSPLLDVFQLLQKDMSLTTKAFKTLFFEKLNKLITEYAKGPNDIKEDKTIQTSIENWLNNKNFPNNENINYIAEMFSEQTSYTEEEIRQYLLIAKLIDKSKIDIESHFEEKSHIMTVEGFKKLIEEYCEPLNNIIFQYSTKLYQLTLIDKPKTSEMEQKFNQLYKELEANIENMPYIAWNKARHHAQKKEFAISVDYYLIALKNGKNSMGHHYGNIIKEGLIVSAHTTRAKQLDLKNPKSPFVKFYKEAYFAKYIDNLHEEINQYFLNDIKKNFSTYFTKLYPNNNSLKANYKAHEQGYASMEDIEMIQPNVKRPNKKIKDIYPNPMSQLMHFALHLKYKEVKQLIQAGADVNETRFNDNGTALTMLLSNPREGKEREDAIKIATLLISNMTKEALNIKSSKSKMTALGQAIDLAYIKIIKELIAHGTDINKTITIYNVSPLYYSVKKISETKIDLETFKERIIPTKDQDILKLVNSMPSTTPFLNNAIRDEEKIEAFKELLEKGNTINKKRFNNSAKFMHQQSTTETETYYQIFNLLLEANPDLELRYKDDLNTVLMLATEIKETGLVKQLLEVGANKDAEISHPYNPSLKYKAIFFAKGDKELTTLLS